MKTKRTTAFLFAVIGVFLVCFSGCNTKPKAETIPPCDIPMQTVTQSSKGELITLEYVLPQGWEFVSKGYFSTLNFEPETYDNIPATAEEDEELLPYVLIIDSYKYPGMSLASVKEESEQDTEQIYKDLFSGITDGYKEKLENDIKYINEVTFYKHNYEKNGDLAILQDFIPQEQYIKDYSVQYYNGTNGKIAVVKYTYEYNSILYQAVDCIRDDITYVVRGGFDNSLSLSSGDIALWVADSLKVTENFTIKDGSIEKIAQ